MHIQKILLKKINQAFIAAGASKNCNPQVHQSTKIEFGHYQVNGVMAEAKKLNVPTRQFAERVLAYLKLSNIASKIEVAGPGFINIFLNPIFLSKKIDFALNSECLGIQKPVSMTIVVDYSSPNIAKEMHVGHLRSTIIGDAFVRTLEFLGHKVIRANHVGDWGTHFGILIAFLEKKELTNAEITLKDLEIFYREAKSLYDANKVFAEYARGFVVKLQNGDEYLLKIWKKIVDITMSKNQIIYNRLKISLSKKDIMGESIYNSMLPDIVKDLKIKGLAVENEGAVVVFLDLFKNKHGKPIGVIIQKKDGGYLYTTTDIACVKYRYEKFHADRIIYYTDSRQYQHFMQVWTIVRQAGYIPKSVSLEHHMFGMMLDKNGKPFKTRTGDTVKLMDLLDEALDRARSLVSYKNPTLSPEKLEKLAHVISIGALKYADLSKNRTTNYVFDWDKMLTFKNNTAPYLQYTYSRIKSLFRKSKVDKDLFMNTAMIFSSNLEVQLALSLLQFEETINLVARDGTPHIMCTYLYNVASLFSRFYESYPILNTKNEEIRNSRLKLTKLTEKTLRSGLNILGIETIEQM